MRPVFVVPLCALLLLMACSSPSGTSERLPTRAPTPTLRPTLTPFAVSARAYYEEGRAHQRAGVVERALQSFTWALQLDSDFAPAYIARGGIRLARGDLREALSDADAALKIEPSNADACALRGEALRLLERPWSAMVAFDRALELDPALAQKTFRSRWLIARAVHDEQRLLGLSREYTEAHPSDPLRHYYRGWALIESDAVDSAVSTLVAGIEDASDPPALLWFALGRAYMAERAWSEAVTTLEVARDLVQRGDASLGIHSQRGTADLFGTLGQAYLRVGRCVDAETMLKHATSLGASLSKYAGALEEARICQTPTPTPTPSPW